MAISTNVSYAYFIAAYTGYTKHGRILFTSGAIIIASLVIAVLFGHMPQKLILLSSGMTQLEYGGWYYILAFGQLVFPGSAVYLLFNKRFTTKIPEQRNSLDYLLLGAGFLLTSNIIIEFVNLPVRR